MIEYVRRWRVAGLGLVALIAMAGPALAAQSAGSTAAADAAKRAETPAVDPRWGVLAGFAERDYEGPNDQTVTIRWEIPGESMAVRFWSPLVSPTYRFRLDRAAGRIELDFPGQWKRRQSPVRTTANGELVLEDQPDAKPFVSRSADGNPHFWGAELTPAVPGSRHADKVAKLVAAGKVRAAGATPGRAAPATVASKGAPRGIEATPPSEPTRADDPRWGLLGRLAGRDFYVGGLAGVLYTFRSDGADLLTITAWNGSKSYPTTVRLNEAAGQLEIKRADGDAWAPVQVDADGSINWSPPGYTQPFKMFSVDGDGQLRVSTNYKLRPLEPGSKFEAKRNQLVSEGKLAPADANPKPLDLAFAPAAGETAATSAANRPATRSAIGGLIGGKPQAAAPAAPGAPVSLAGLEFYVGKTYYDATKSGQQSIIRTRWIEPGKVYEWSREGEFGPASILRWTVGADGSLTGAGADGESRTGSLDSAGLPATISESGGKEWLSSLLTTPTGLVVVSSENRAKKGKPAKWKERSRHARRVIDDVEANAMIRQWAEARRRRWGALELMAGKDWFCTQYEPTHWTTRTIRFHTQFGRSTNRSLPTMRLTSARWIEPYSVLEVSNTLGTGQKWTDRITLAADGNFDMVTDGISNWSRMRGLPDGQGGIAFNMGSLTFMGSTSPINIEFKSYANSSAPITQMTGTYAGPPCVLEPYDDAKLAEWQQRLDAERRSVAESMQWDNDYWQDAAQHHAEGQQMLANMRGAMFREVFIGIPQAIADVNQRKAELNVLRQAAEQETAMRRAAEERAERDRLAAENARRVQEANARQEAIAQQNAARRADNEAQVSAARAQADADRARRAEQQRVAAEETARRDAEQRQEAAEAERQKREAQAAADAERRRQAEQQRLAEQRRKEEEARRPVAFKEGIVVCEKKREKYYRCEGPLQVTYSDLASPAGMTSLGEACGARTTRDLGMAGGFRIFGCGFGIHPTLRDYPGNRDVPAEYGLYIADRATFYCPRSTSAYCRGR